MEKPNISVIMGTFNTPHDYLRDSINSILNQTYTNFEFIIIDDASTNQSEEIIKTFKDKRIVYIKNETNQGLTKSLNIGLQYAKGKYIARMDADDISLPSRLEKQILFLENHRDIDILGSNIIQFGENKKEQKISIPRSREKQHIALLFGNFGIPHPTAMIRKDFLSKNKIKYNETYKKSQDYGLWVDCVKYGKLAVLDDFLLKYRIHSNQISTKSLKDQDYYADMIRIEQLYNLFENIDELQKDIHLDLCHGRKRYSSKVYKDWINVLIYNNESKKVYNKKILKEELKFKWYIICYKYFVKEKNIKMVKDFVLSLSFKNLFKQIALHFKIVN